MTSRVVLLAGLFLLTAAQPRPVVQRILVLCSADACEFRRVTAITIGGKDRVRSLPYATGAVIPASAGNFQEVRADLVTMYRDARSGAVFEIGADGKPTGVVVPTKLAGNQPLLPPAIWQGLTLGYADAATPKVKASATLDRLAYFIVSPDPEGAISGLVPAWLDNVEPDPRRLALLRGAFGFTTGPTSAMWRDMVAARMLADLTRFENQTGDPTTLVASLENAMVLRGVLLPASEGDRHATLSGRVAAADDIFRRRVAIAEGLRKAQLWDEYLVKLDQLGMVKWSLPDVLPRMRDALRATSQAHYEAYRKLTADGSLDRAFDEAAIAAKTSCDETIRRRFSRARLDFVDRNKIAAAPEYAGSASDKRPLDQIVRGLDVLAANLEQQILRRITEGEELDPDYLPVQLKKAEFLAKLGRYGQALDVLWRIERHIRLDPKQLEMALGLDGRIDDSLADAIRRAMEEVAKQYGAMEYQKALDAARKGLTADPTHASLLFHAAISAAFLKQKDEALGFIQTYFKGANITCEPATQGPANSGTLLELYRRLTSGAASGSAGGFPNWMSGARYAAGQVFYDPISLGFHQPVQRISTEDGSLSTVFFRDDRSLTVRGISTQRTNAGRQGTAPITYSEEFAAEPTYHRPTLTMIEVGPRANSTGERVKYALTYWNSPTMDVDLVQRQTKKQIARGWAGNPFFHPFIWNGFYIFNLTYDDRGRVILATPVSEGPGTQRDKFSELLEFTWAPDSPQLLSIRGTVSGYLRTLYYDKAGLLKSEVISYGKRGGGRIDYSYVPNSAVMASARATDEFYDGRTRLIAFDVNRQEAPAQSTALPRRSR